MSYYCTLDQARSQLKAVSTSDDALLLMLIRTVSSRIDKLLGSIDYFESSQGTRQYTIRSTMVNSNAGLLYLPDMILSLTNVTLNGVVLAVPGTVSAYPIANAPATTLRIKYLSWYSACSADYPEPLVAVDGVFGYHDDYARAWQNVDSLQSNINSSTTTITVANASGNDNFGESPRFSAGQLLRVDNEYLRVVGVNRTSNALTVLRAQNGSTAAAHLQNASIFIWQVMSDVQHETARQVGMLYARRGAYEQISQNEIGVVSTYPQDLTRSLRHVITQYMVS